MSQLFCRSHTSRLTILSVLNLINAHTPRASAVFLVFMTSNVIDRASIPMVPSLMLSAMVLHPLSPVPKTGSRSEPNQEVLYSRLMTAQRINGNCLSRSTKIFLFSDQLVFFFAVLRHLTFPLRLYPFMRLYRVFPLLVAFSHSHSSFSSCYLSLSRPDHRHCLVAEQNSKMQRRRPLAAFPNRAAACSLTKRCVLLRRKMAKVEETYGEGVRGARSSSEYRRGVYAALIVGTNPPHLFAESFSIRQFLFLFLFFI